ncbi:hypothetical protein LBMAG53_01450 [Planctomycetota bacterium]|nr:hypothetical protein LBMAG53_01450 [Planctomycetota bacterium]
MRFLPLLVAALAAAPASDNAWLGLELGSGAAAFAWHDEDSQGRRQDLAGAFTSVYSGSLLIGGGDFGDAGLGGRIGLGLRLRQLSSQDLQLTEAGWFVRFAGAWEPFPWSELDVAIDVGSGVMGASLSGMGGERSHNGQYGQAAARAELLFGPRRHRVGAFIAGEITGGGREADDCGCDRSAFSYSTAGWSCGFVARIVP